MQHECRLQNSHAHPELNDEPPQVDENMNADEDGTTIVVCRQKCPHDEDASEDGVEWEKELGNESQRCQVAGSLSQHDEPGQGSGEEELWELKDDTREVAHCQVAEAQLAKQQLAKVILKLSAPSQSNVAPRKYLYPKPHGFTLQNKTKIIQNGWEMMKIDS